MAVASCNAKDTFMRRRGFAIVKSRLEKGSKVSDLGRWAGERVEMDLFQPIRNLVKSYKKAPQLFTGAFGDKVAAVANITMMVH